jgi:hypothetical protein
MTDDLRRSHPPTTSTSTPNPTHTRPATSNFTMHTARCSTGVPAWAPISRSCASLKSRQQLPFNQTSCFASKNQWPLQAAPDFGDQEEKVRKAVLGLFVALAAALAVVPLASASQTETVACCGGGPGFP